MVVAALPAPIGASQMFHVDAMHSGRSRFKAPTAQPKETMHVATGGVVYSSPADHRRRHARLRLARQIGLRRRRAAATSSGAIRRATSSGARPRSARAASSTPAATTTTLYAFDLADGNVRWTFTAGPCRVSTGVGPEGARCDVDGVTVARRRHHLRQRRRPLRARLRRQAQVEVLARRHPLRGHARRRPRRHRLRRLPRRRALRHRPRRAKALGLPRRRRRRQLARGHAPTASSTSAATTTSSTRSAPAARCAGPSPPAAPSAARPPSPPTAPSTSAASTARSTPCDPGGVVAWSFRTADRIVSSPRRRRRRQRPRRLAKTIACTRSRPTASCCGSLLLDGDVDATPAIGPDGTIYVGNDDRALHALR